MVVTYYLTKSACAHTHVCNVHNYFINLKTEFIRITFIILAKLTLYKNYLSIHTVEITVVSHGKCIVILSSIP